MEELSRVELRRLSRLNTFQRIARSLPNLIIIAVDLMYFVMLSNVFRKCTCKQRSKGSPIKAVMRLQSQDKLGTPRVCCDV